MGAHSDKARRITVIRDWNSEDYDLPPLESETELERRLPEIMHIDDEELQQQTKDAFMEACPAYFWERPSSSSGKYHPVDERGKYGNWLHTKRVFIQYCNLASVDLAMDRITKHQFECGKSAALLHDMMKYGWPSDNNSHTVDSHDVIASAVSKHMTRLPDEVTDMIHSHMSKWGEGRNPETVNQWLLCRADKAVSPEWSTIGVYHPAKELIEELNIVGYEFNGTRIQE